MEKYNHVVDRNLIQWGSYGKFGNRPIRHTLIKDLSDSHLMRVIEHVTARPNIYTQPFLQFLKEEVTFRTNNYIFVPETYD